MSSEELGEVVPPHISTWTSRFRLLNPRQSPVPMSSEEQVVVESPTQYEAPVESLDVSPAADKQLLPLESQVSLISSVQLLPNRVREDFTYDTLDVFPVFQVSQKADGYFPDTSPVMSPDARSIPSSQVAPAPVLC